MGNGRDSEKTGTEVAPQPRKAIPDTLTAEFMKLVKMKICATEHQEQVALVKWFRTQYREYARCLFSIPNGAMLCDLSEEKRQHRMAYLMAEGVLLGASDLFLAIPCDKYAGLFVEMKAENKTVSSLSAHQKLFLQEMKKRGYAAEWANGFERAVEIFRAYMFLVKGQKK